MANLIIVAGQVAILFALMAIGFACRKTKIITEKGIGEIVALLILIINPCLIVDAFNRRYDPAMLQGLLVALGLAVLLHILLLLVARIAFRGGREETRIVLKLSSAMSNAGFMGIPLEQAVLGSEGVFYGVAYVAVFNLFIWSWGLGLCADGRLRLTRRMVLNPGMYALLGGLLVFFLPFDLPKIASETLGFVSGMNTPLAMMVIGFYLAGADLKVVARRAGASAAIFLRLIVSPLLSIAVLYFLRAELSQTLMLALVIPASAPVAAMTSMFAAQYNRDVSLSAALVSTTTLLSIVTMPIMIAFAIWILV